MSSTRLLAPESTSQSPDTMLLTDLISSNSARPPARPRPQEVAKVIAEARANNERDEQAPAEGTEGDIPQELVDEDDRLARLLAAKARLGAEVAERQAAYEAKLAKRKEFKEATGREMVGHKPKLPEERQKDAQRSKKANTTDPDSLPCPPPTRATSVVSWN